MKIGYWILISVLVIAAAVCAYLTNSSWGEKYPHLGDVIQVVSVFVALLAAIVTLSAADPKKHKVKYQISPIEVAVPKKYEKNKMAEEVKQCYENLRDSVVSWRVNFKIKNCSGFDWEKPVITFRVPNEKKHPGEEKDGKINTTTFHSNIYNSQYSLLECKEDTILTNSGLLYWNDGDEIAFWIRMVLDDGKSEPFNIEVSVNCENADGVTEKVQIKPQELLEQP